MDKIMGILSIVGAVVIAVPAFLHALNLFLKAIPGAPGAAGVEKVEAVAQKIADIAGKLLPGANK